MCVRTCIACISEFLCIFTYMCILVHTYIGVREFLFYVQIYVCANFGSLFFQNFCVHTYIWEYFSTSVYMCERISVLYTDICVRDFLLLAFQNFYIHMYTCVWEFLFYIDIYMCANLCCLLVRICIYNNCVCCLMRIHMCVRISILYTYNCVWEFLLLTFENFYVHVCACVVFNFVHIYVCENFNIHVCACVVLCTYICVWEFLLHINLCMFDHHYFWHLRISVVRCAVWRESKGSLVSGTD